ncbi:macro domain-containing protein [Kibdelosporangium philippinense]|uniref:Macro domain-containing protein n=1 Tax=Kibdelosporangium philippinense TaxID=211113 RepID=A0ABS8ZM59_9PSEU|nr:macro domain-containing protein [Kibdelosporangium philippinense]MCE7008602.1 macro domain-containing protein [Kibdelosporangium philippinense]
MITEKTGDLLAADTVALVNAVNCVGVMGKGIALQFKRKFPDNFAAYAAACARGEVHLGQMFVVTEPRLIINFPTKQHWRSRSRLPDIEAGLEDLVRVVRDMSIKSIAVPALGSGHGGLPWPSVDALIHEAFAALSDVKVLLYLPFKQD